MLSGRAFRAQLVMQGQRELFDYWLLSAGIRRMPARSDLDPLKVPQSASAYRPDRCQGWRGLAPLSGWPGRGCTTFTVRKSPASAPAKCFRATRPIIGVAFMPGVVAKGLPLQRCGAGTGQGPRPYRIVLVEVTAVRGWRPGRSHPLLRRGRLHRERARSAPSVRCSAIPAFSRSGLCRGGCNSAEPRAG